MPTAEENKTMYNEKDLAHFLFEREKKWLFNVDELSLGKDITLRWSELSEKDRQHFLFIARCVRSYFGVASE